MFVNIEQAINTLRHGGIVALPTETVYGLADDASCDDAITKIYQQKQRPVFNPLISHVSDMNMAMAYGIFSETALALANRFWAGALTLIVPQRNVPLHDYPPLSPQVTAGLDTVALRIPAHPVMQQIIHELQRPLAAPSANKSGHITCTNAFDVAYSFADDALAIVIDETACAVGVESTIVYVVDNDVKIMRQGGISYESLQQIVPDIRLADTPPNHETIISPGQLLKHYAPKNAEIFLNQTSCPIDAGFIAFGTDYLPECAYLYQLSDDKNLEQAGHHLFKSLYEMEKRNITKIYIAPLPDYDIGRTLNERLKRASCR